MIYDEISDMNQYDKMFFRSSDMTCRDLFYLILLFTYVSNMRKSRLRYNSLPKKLFFNGFTGENQRWMRNFVWTETWLP